MRLIVVAMESEINQYLKDATMIEETPFKIYQKKEHLILISKIGKVNAAASLSYVLSKYPIDSIINIGFAGGQLPAKMFDIYEINACQYHDFNLVVFGYELNQVPNMPTRFAPKLLNLYPESKLYTGDKFVTQELEEGHVLYDMEGTSFCQVALLYQIPITLIKVVSDVIGSDRQMDDYKAFEFEIGAKIIHEILNKVGV